VLRAETRRGEEGGWSQWREREEEGESCEEAAILWPRPALCEPVALNDQLGKCNFAALVTVGLWM